MRVKIFFFFASLGLKYFVPTISVISVTDLWSVISISKKENIKLLLSFDKTIITRCGDLILHKIPGKYQKIWIIKKGTFIQRHLHHIFINFLCNLYGKIDFW